MPQDIIVIYAENAFPQSVIHEKTYKRTTHQSLADNYISFNDIDGIETIVPFSCVVSIKIIPS